MRRGKDRPRVIMTMCMMVRPADGLSRAAFGRFADSLPSGVLRAKGFVALSQQDGGLHVFQMTARRWTLTPVGADRPMEPIIVFIGTGEAAATCGACPG
ncbi:hypothetical protein BH23PSE1_BH23PSE1_00730 [soil metagenome]